MLLDFKSYSLAESVSKLVQETYNRISFSQGWYNYINRNFFLRVYLFIFRERGREGEREREKHQCVVAFHMPATGDLAHNPGMCPGLGI